MKFVMIIMIFTVINGGYATSTTSVEFEDKAACTQARERVLKMSMYAYAECFPKATKP